MSILDLIKSKAPPEIQKVVGALIENAGGLEGVVAKFTNGGMTEVVHSWIGTGENMTVSPEQLQKVLGSDMLEKIAAKTGMDANDLSSKLSSFLPSIIDMLTPDGKLPPKGASNA